MNHSHVSCCVDRSPYTVLCFDWSDKIFPLWSSYWFSLSRIPLPVKWWGSVEEWPWKRAWLWVFYGRKRAKIDFFIIVWGVFFPKKINKRTATGQRKRKPKCPATNFLSRKLLYISSRFTTGYTESNHTPFSCAFLFIQRHNGTAKLSHQ